MGLRHRGRAVDLRLQMTYPMNNSEPDQRAVLTITDDASGMVILDIELDAAGVLALLSNHTAAPVLAGMTIAPERIGKVMQHETCVFEPSVFRDLNDAQRAAYAWAERDGWDVGEASKRNDRRWQLIRRRWVERTPLAGA